MYISSMSDGCIALLTLHQHRCASLSDVARSPQDELLCEEKLSWALVLVICVLVLCVFLTYFLVLSHFRYLPESVAVIGLGVCMCCALHVYHITLEAWKDSFVDVSATS